MAWHILQVSIHSINDTNNTSVMITKPVPLITIMKYLTNEVPVTTHTTNTSSSNKNYQPTIGHNTLLHQGLQCRDFLVTLCNPTPPKLKINYTLTCNYISWICTFLKQLDSTCGEEQAHTLWPVKFCHSAGANSHEETRFLATNLTTSLYHQIKTQDSWVARVDFLWNSINKRAVLATALPKWNINDLHVELGHPSEAIMRSTTKVLGIQVTSTFNPCKDCALG